MLPRMNKNYKERNSFTMLSRFVLPLSVIMVLVLLFISVKLLFISPDGLTSATDSVCEERTGERAEPVRETLPEPVKPVEKEEVKVSAEKPAGTIVLASPVDMPSEVSSPKAKKEIKKPQKSTPVKKTVKKTEVKPAKAKKRETPAKVSKPAPAKQVKAPEKKAVKQESGAASERWDIQVGGFSSKESAQGVMKKVTSDGYSAYIVESSLNSKPFYKIRVKGSADKSEAQALSKRLEEKGYPVYVVNTSK